MQGNGAFGNFTVTYDFVGAGRPGIQLYGTEGTLQTPDPNEFGGPVRLFRRDMARYHGPSDHGEVCIASGKVGVLRERCLHYTGWSYDQWFEKCHRYTTVQAQQWYEQGRRPSYLRLLLHFPARFLREYILKLGFLDGYVGLQLATLAGFYSFMKQARLWELHHAMTPPQTQGATPHVAPSSPAKTTPLSNRRSYVNRRVSNSNPHCSQGWTRTATPRMGPQPRRLSSLRTTPRPN